MNFLPPVSDFLDQNSQPKDRPRPDRKIARKINRTIFLKAHNPVYTFDKEYDIKTLLRAVEDVTLCDEKSYSYGVRTYSVLTKPK